MLIRKAELSDIAFIEELLIRGCEERHFGPTVKIQAKAMLEQVIKYGSLEFMLLRNNRKSVCTKKVEIFVAVLNGETASFIINALYENEAELHLAYTHKNFRRKGLFLNLLMYSVERYEKDMKINRIYARCYNKSSWAKECLLKNGFSVSQYGNPEELQLDT